MRATWHRDFWRGCSVVRQFLRARGKGLIIFSVLVNQFSRKNDIVPRSYVRDHLQRAASFHCPRLWRDRVCFVFLLLKARKMRESGPHRQSREYYAVFFYWEKVGPVPFFLFFSPFFKYNARLRNVFSVFKIWNSAPVVVCVTCHRRRTPFYTPPVSHGDVEDEFNDSTTNLWLKRHDGAVNRRRSPSSGNIAGAALWQERDFLISAMQRKLGCKDGPESRMDGAEDLGPILPSDTGPNFG